ncbi:MAG: chromate transporter [Clostridia bacterium]|nr:chromate transporter [Clostridia bacterium]
MIYLRLFYEFFKIGLFSVGGGLATLPFLQDLGARTGWFSSADLSNMIAVSESTPGPIGVNMATYTGYVSALGEYDSVFAGILGGLVATLGLIAPAIVTIMIVSKILEKFRDNRFVNAAFYGLRAVSIALISAVGVSVISTNLFNIDGFKVSGNFADLFVLKAIILAVVIFVLQKVFKKVHPTAFIALAAVVGIVFNFN